MRAQTVWLIAGLSFGAVVVAATPVRPATPQAIDQKRIALLIRDLDANAYAVRESASDELLKIGEPAVPAIKAALADRPSTEVRARAEQLIRQIIVWGDMPHELSLPAVMGLLKESLAAKDPAKDCRDGRLEHQLDCWVRVLAQVGGRQGGRLPVAFDDVTFAAFGERGDEDKSWRKSLLIIKHGRIKSATECIILTDGPVIIDAADHCIVLARSVVSLSACRNSIVIAGQVVDASASTGSLLIGGYQALIDGTCDSVVAADSAVATGSNNAVVLVNARLDDGSAADGIRAAKLPELRLGDPATKNHVAEQVQLLETLWQGDRVARVRVAGGNNQVIHCGESLTGAGGKPIAGLERWALCFAKSDTALFSNGDDFAVLRVKR